MEEFSRYASNRIEVVLARNGFVETQSEADRLSPLPIKDCAMLQLAFCTMRWILSTVNSCPPIVRTGGDFVRSAESTTP